MRALKRACVRVTFSSARCSACNAFAEHGFRFQVVFAGTTKCRAGLQCNPCKTMPASVRTEAGIVLHETKLSLRCTLRIRDALDREPGLLRGGELPRLTQPTSKVCG